jgi:CDP-glucose 4,6-dehydratase
MSYLYGLNDFYKNKSVFLTGHTGFKGSWLSFWLLSLGAKVTGYALEPPTDPSLFRLLNLERDINSIHGDVRNLESMKKHLAASNPDIVIHMAAQPLVRDSYKIPVETYSTNVMGTVHLLEAVRSVDSVTAVVNVTTDKCYDNKEWVWGYREDEPMGGYDPYSNSKGCSELVTSSYRNSFFNPKDHGKKHSVALASARAGNVIGGGDWAMDRLIPDIIRSYLKKEKVLIRSPYAIRPWQHVLEPLSGYLLLGKKLHEDGPAYSESWNFGPDDSDARPVEWIVNKLCVLWGEGSSFDIDQNPQPHEAAYLKLDCSKAKTRLGWHPRWGLDTALDKIVEWTKAYQGNSDAGETCRRQIEEYVHGSH